MARTSRNSVRGTKNRRRRRFFNYPRSHVRGIRRWLPSWRVILGTMLMGLGMTIGLLYAAYTTTPTPTAALDSVNNQTTTVLWGDGKTQLTTFAAENREIVPFDTLPKWVGNAVVASEDQTFWTNSGVDPKGILRAFVNNVRGGPRQGGSTLTQQYVERYYTNTNTSYAGKFREAIMAFKVGQKQPKEVILGNYLNTIYFGRGAYGIQAASKAYFGKSAKDLNYSEAAMLAGIVPSPVNWDPERNLAQATARWNRTLNNMAADHYITATDRSAAIFPTTIPYQGTKSDKLAGTNGYLITMVEDELTKSGILTDDELLTGGYTITTTIDPQLQQEAVETMNNLTHMKGASPLLRGALVSINPKDGGIKAVYGGPDYMQNKFNNAVQGKAQGGSTFKPFTLIAALDQGHQLNETYDGNNGIAVGTWSPVNNFGKQSFGTIDLIKATQDSVNAVYAQLNADIGPQSTVDAAHNLGVKSTVEANDANVLGTATVSPKELANAYATIANRGVKFDAHIVAKVVRKDGSVKWEAPTTGKEVYSPEVIDAATYAMTQVVQKGSGKTARELGRPAAGKTGTSNDNKSAWFAGFVPQLATVVGLYQDTPKDENGKVGQASITPFGGFKEITGGTLPTEAWTDFMKLAMKDQPKEKFPKYTPPPRKVTESASPTQTPTPTEAPPTPTQEPEQTQQPDDQMVTVPNDMVGYSASSVIATLHQQGLYPLVTEEYSDAEVGSVIAVMPAGQNVPAGATVSVVVSKGPDPASQEPQFDQPSRKDRNATPPAPAPVAPNPNANPTPTPNP